MKVILTQHVPNLGQKGEVKEVSEGYFRNSLAPRRLARPATGGAVKDMQAKKAKAVEKLENMKESAQAVYDKINDKQITIAEKVSDAGHLYAAVSTKEVKEAIHEQLKANVPVRAIEMSSIKEPGDHTITVKLFKSISATLTLHVTAQ